MAPLLPVNAMSRLVPSVRLRSLCLCALSLPFVACGSPERDDGNYEPWGGIPIDDGADDEDDADEGGSVGEDGNADDGNADDGNADDGNADDGNADDGNADDGNADDGPPPDDPPGSPYVGGWDIGTCQDDISPTGTGVGQVVPDFLLFDQFGDQVRLYDFCHEAVYIVAGAFW